MGRHCCSNTYASRGFAYWNCNWICRWNILCLAFKKELIKFISMYANDLIENQNELIIGFNQWAENNQNFWKKYITGIAFKRDFMAKKYYCDL